MQDILKELAPKGESSSPVFLKQLRRPETDVSIWDKLEPQEPQLTFPNRPITPKHRRTFQFDPGELSPDLKLQEILQKLEHVISTAAKYTLFEFNDEFTRQCLKDITEPYLNHAKLHECINDFRVVCDESNNLPSTVDSGQFVAEIYIKPKKSVNYIQLNFVATKSNVDFSEIVGQF